MLRLQLRVQTGQPAALCRFGEGYAVGAWGGWSMGRLEHEWARGAGGSDLNEPREQAGASPRSTRGGAAAARATSAPTSGSGAGCCARSRSPSSATTAAADEKRWI